MISIRNIWVIMKRELLSLFVSPIAYIIITSFILLCAYFFYSYLAMYVMAVRQFGGLSTEVLDRLPSMNEYVIGRYYLTISLVLVFMIPVLTMRTIAEEKRNKTFEMLAISPLSVSDIVLGKFLGVSAVLIAMLLCSFAYPLILAPLGVVEFLPMLTALLGIILYAVALASIGVAISSFTENQIVAAVAGMVVMVLMYVISNIASSAEGAWKDVLEYIAPSEQLVDMLFGVIQTSSLVYFLSLIALGIFLSQRAIEAHRWR